MFCNYLNSSYSLRYKNLSSNKPSQWHGDTQNVGSSALQEIFAGFQQRNLCMVGRLDEKKQRETATPNQTY